MHRKDNIMKNVKEIFSIKIALLVFLCILCFTFSGCNKQDVINKTFEEYELGKHEEVLGALVNYI